MNIKQAIFFLLILIAHQSCIETQSSKGYKQKSAKKYSIPETDISVDSNTVFTLFGTPLPPKQLGGRDASTFQRQLKRAYERYLEKPEEIDIIIEYGRKLSNIGLYYESIKVFSEGLEKHPSSFRLLRHRGHRYITIRQFDLAIDDLQRAAFYSRPAKNEIELDDIRKRNKSFISNDKFNIYYYLGIAHYLKGSYDKCISSFKKCATFANNDELKVCVTHWFYLTYQKIGNEKAANDLLLPITRKTKAIYNSEYLNLLMVYKGLYEPATVLSYAENEDKSINPVLGYGIANWYLFKGEIEKPTRILDLVLQSHSWDCLEYIATESYIKSMQGL